MMESRLEHEPLTLHTSRDPYYPGNHLKASAQIEIANNVLRLYNIGKVQVGCMVQVVASGTTWCKSANV